MITTADHTEAAFYAAIDEQKRMFNRRLCFLPDGVGVPGHACIGPNRVVGFDGFFRTSEIIAHIQKAAPQPQTIAFADIWHQLHYAEERAQGTRPDDPRFQAADPAFPGIVAELKNPGNKPFRMLDGRRRLWKQELAGATEGQFYVIPVAEVFRFFWMVMPYSALRQMLQQVD